jgi:excisionase family DNA binding protein
MTGSHPDPRKVKLHRPYEVEEAAIALGVHKRTIQRWIKFDGLRVASDKRPKLIRGEDIRHFLEGRRSKARSKSPPGHAYCFRCRAPRKPLDGLSEYHALTDKHGQLRAICEVCETIMCRAIKRADLVAFERLGEVIHSGR